MRETLGHYRILDRLGVDGIGELYRARDTQLGRTAAVRVVGEAIRRDPERLRQLLADARAAAAVSHPNIAALYEVAEDGGVNYLAGEYVAGQKLHGLIAGRPLNPRRAVDLTIQIADALAEASVGEVAHGGVSTDTIVVTAKGNAKLLDFGLTRWLAEGRSRGTDDHQADIAALGRVLYEMLTGAAPSDGPAPGIDARLPAELGAVVRKALAAPPDEGYESAATLAAELRSVLIALDGRAESAIAPSPTAPARTRTQTALIWFVVLAILAGTGWLVWMAAAAK